MLHCSAEGTLVPKRQALRKPLSSCMQWSDGRLLVQQCAVQLQISLFIWQSADQCFTAQQDGICELAIERQGARSLLPDKGM